MKRWRHRIYVNIVFYAIQTNLKLNTSIIYKLRLKQKKEEGEIAYWGNIINIHTNI